MSGDPSRRPNVALIARRPRFEREKSWETVAYGFQNGQLSTTRDEHAPDQTIGHCVVTLGTGTHSNVVWDDVEILPSHSYPVIGSSLVFIVCNLCPHASLPDVDDSDGIGILTILDTWVNPGQEKQSKEQSSKCTISCLSHP